MGNFSELEEKYGLLFNYSDSEEALKKAVELIKDPELKKTWGIKRAALLKDKIDVTEFMVKLIEGIPKEERRGKKGVSVSTVSDENHV
ncbi:hypothetical protein SDC9_136925 [bioreactor metagenome]|uniref:Uncharacterized protein n=1 Tax=bioreactor metagenome TaxID=1076179 RepID=A0A645DK52_9ZZZZ